MRVLLDECLPRRLAAEFPEHQVTTVPQAGWAGVSNGKLLAKISGQYDALITVDQNLPAQQRTQGLSFGIMVLRSSSNQLADLRPLVPQIRLALESLQPGQVVTIAAAQA